MDFQPQKELKADNDLIVGFFQMNGFAFDERIPEPVRLFRDDLVRESGSHACGSMHFGRGDDGGWGYKISIVWVDKEAHAVGLSYKEIDGMIFVGELYKMPYQYFRKNVMENRANGLDIYLLRLRENFLIASKPQTLMFREMSQHPQL